MLQDIVKKDSTDRSVTVKIIDDTDGTPETGVVYNTAGIDLWYRREGGLKIAITEAVLATPALDNAHTDGGFLHVGNGVYRLDLPDAAFATGAEYVDFGGTVTDMIVIGGRVRLVDFDLETATQGVDVTTWNGTAVATPDTAGFPKVTIKQGTGTGELQINSGYANTDVGMWNGISISTGASGYPQVDIVAINDQTTNVSTMDSFYGSYNTNGYVTVDTSGIVDAVWDEDIVAAHTTADTAGEKLASAGAGGDPWSTSIPGAYGAGTAGYILGNQNDLSAAEVNAEVDTALVDIHLDHLLAVDYDPSSKPGIATALLNELVENDAGVSRFTSNALEQGAASSGLTPLASGTAQSATSTTLVLASASSFADDELNTTVVNIVSGTGVGQSRVITDYVGSTDTATVSPAWTTTPDSSSNYEVVNGTVNIATIDGGSSTNTAGLLSMATSYTANGYIDVNLIAVETVDASDSLTATVDASLVAIGLDHLLSVSIADTDVADDSFLAKIVDNAATADFTNWDHTTHSMTSLLRSGNPTMEVELTTSGVGDVGWPSTNLAASAMTGIAALDTYYQTNDVPLYHADVQLDIDNTNTADEYLCVWKKDDVALESGVTSPVINVYDKAGTLLITAQAMLTIGVQGFKHIEATNRVSVGESYIVVVTATIDGSTRTWKRIIGRDDL